MVVEILLNKSGDDEALDTMDDVIDMKYIDKVDGSLAKGLRGQM